MKPRFIVQQKITAFANKYEVYANDASTGKGQLLAFAQQKRLAFKEKVTFFSDETKSTVVFSFRAEKLMDIHGRFIVEDAEGRQIGAFKKEFKQSLLNSTWSLLDSNDQPKLQISESSQALAIFRRFGGLIPIVGGLVDIATLLLRYHFVVTNVSTAEIEGRYVKTKLLRDYYELSMTDAAYDQQDWRVVAALAVALDALQSR